MNVRSSLAVSALLLAVAAGCYTGSAVDSNRGPDTPTTSTDGTDPAPASSVRANDPDATVAITSPMGLPCDVAEVIKACATCHGDELSGGAPNRLLTFDDLAAPSESDPERTEADLSLSRMKSATRPMPPTGALPSEAIAVFEKWLTDGRPRGTCGEPHVSAEAGTHGEIDAGVDASVPDAGPTVPPVVASVCTSGTPGLNVLGAPMKPGYACLSCHRTNDKPFAIAGTVYPTLHEPNKCNGVKSVSPPARQAPAPGTIALKVRITDERGITHELPVNEAGNFYLPKTTQVIGQYSAEVVDGSGNIRRMPMKQTNGDCNGCHSELGQGASGRITP